MEFVNLGDSGLKVSKVIFRGISIGPSPYKNWSIEEDEALLLMEMAYDVGIRTFDIGSMYSKDQVENIFGKFLKKYNIPRSTIVIMTKVSKEGAATGQSVHNCSSLSRKNIFDSVDESVERLGTYVDVLQIHHLDRHTSMSEIMKSLHDVVQSGKVRYIGASSMRATEFAQLQFIAEKNGWTKFISMQTSYNAAYREDEREMIPFCRATGVGNISLSPISHGLLSRPVPTDTSDDLAEPLRKIVSGIEQVAKKRGKSMAQIAVAWVLSKGCTSVVSLHHEKLIDGAIDALSIKLTDAECQLIEDPYLPQPMEIE